MKALGRFVKAGLEWFFLITKMYHYIISCFMGIAFMLLARKLENPAILNYSYVVVALSCIAIFTLKFGFRKKDKLKKAAFTAMLVLATLFLFYAYLTKSLFPYLDY